MAFSMTLLNCDSIKTVQLKLIKMEVCCFSSWPSVLYYIDMKWYHEWGFIYGFFHDVGNIWFWSFHVQKYHFVSVFFSKTTLAAETLHGVHRDRPGCYIKNDLNHFQAAFLSILNGCLRLSVFASWNAMFLTPWMQWP